MAGVYYCSQVKQNTVHSDNHCLHCRHSACLRGLRLEAAAGIINFFRVSTEYLHNHELLLP